MLVGNIGFSKLQMSTTEKGDKARSFMQSPIMDQLTFGRTKEVEQPTRRKVIRWATGGVVGSAPFIAGASNSQEGCEGGTPTDGGAGKASARPEKPTRHIEPSGSTRTASDAAKTVRAALQYRFDNTLGSMDDGPLIVKTTVIHKGADKNYYFVVSYQHKGDEEWKAAKGSFAVSSSEKAFIMNTDTDSASLGRTPPSLIKNRAVRNIQAELDKDTGAITLYETPTINLTDTKKRIEHIRGGTAAFTDDMKPTERL